MVRIIDHIFNATYSQKRKNTRPQTQWEGSSCTESALILFSLFPIGSLQVFNMFSRFPMCSPKVFPIATRFKSHMFCAKSSPSHLYMWAKGGGTPSFHRIFYILGAFLVSTPFYFYFFCNGPIKLAHCKLKKVGLLRHPFTN
jgi:hypothetical protein